MSNNVKRVELDATNVLKMFDELDARRQRNSIQSALKKSARIITTQAKTNLKSRLGRKSATHKRHVWYRWKVKNKRTKVDKSISLVQGIDVAADMRKGLYAVAHARGHYMLRFFEGGTDERYWRSKSQKHTGRLNALYFFRDATSMKKQESQDTLMDNLE